MKNNLIGVTGASGKVGRELIRRGCIPLECDVTKIKEVLDSIQKSGVELVIHCAAITDVDYCEKKENEREVFSVNVRGTNAVVTACQVLGINMVYISTDHVFDGKRWIGSYKETDRPNPINYYGYSKWSGELICGLTSNDRVKVIRKPDSFREDHFVDGLMTFIRAFDSMPKLLHIGPRQKRKLSIRNGRSLSVSLAEKLGITLYSDIYDDSWPHEDLHD